MRYIFRLIRIQNLLIIALTQYLFRYTILIPVMKLESIEPALSHFNFALLVLSTVLVAAAGYAINDYFDLRIDRINKKKRIIVGKHFSRRQVMTLHTVFSIVAVILGAYVSFRIGSVKLATINLVMVILLWMYSVKYKAYFLVGNIIVSFATAMTIIVVWLFEAILLSHAGRYFITSNHLVSTFVWLYAAFAFIISLIREIVKDIEDIDGDSKVGCSTIPVVIGIKKTKLVVLALIALTVAALSYMSYEAIVSFRTKIIFGYLIVALILPFIYMAYTIIVSKEKNDYSYVSRIAKYLMLAGVLSMTLLFLRF